MMLASLKARVSGWSVGLKLGMERGTPFRSPRQTDTQTNTQAPTELQPQQGYNYRLTAPQPGGGTILIAETPDPPSAPVTAFVHTINNRWTLQIAPAAGWVPTWRRTMLAMVILVCFVLGLMLTGLLVNRRQQAWLVSELKVTELLGGLRFRPF